MNKIICLRGLAGFAGVACANGRREAAAISGDAGACDQTVDGSGWQPQDAAALKPENVGLLYRFQTQRRELCNVLAM